MQGSPHFPVNPQGRATDILVAGSVLCSLGIYSRGLNTFSALCCPQDLGSCELQRQLLFCNS